jgi:ubiquinone/menaquinone biosynthesis C-methylase UbiE
MQEYKMLKNGIKVINEKGLNYIVKDGGKFLKFKPWLGDAFSFLYDFIMKSSIFPKKFGGDMNQHYEILRKELEGVHKKRVMELATGSGSAVNFLPNDNQYTGTDISPGLLRKAVKRFRHAGFKNAEFYVTSADGLPFDDNLFDIVLCILSLNFFSDIKKVLKEVKRVAAPASIFICSVPVPERNKVQSTIRGTLYSEEELGRICKEQGLSYETTSSENGALLYFRAIIQ